MKRRFIKLINNERNNAKITSIKATENPCSGDATSEDLCTYVDRYVKHHLHCSTDACSPIASV